jgi:hypothetical protein
MLAYRSHSHFERGRVRRLSDAQSSSRLAISGMIAKFQAGAHDGHRVSAGSEGPSHAPDSKVR